MVDMDLEDSEVIVISKAFVVIAPMVSQTTSPSHRIVYTQSRGPVSPVNLRVFYFKKKCTIQCVSRKPKGSRTSWGITCRLPKHYLPPFLFMEDRDFHDATNGDHPLIPFSLRPRAIWEQAYCYEMR